MMRSSLQPLVWVLYAAFFATPFVVLIVNTDTFFPYIFYKNIAFRSLVEIMAVSWVVLAYFEPRYRIQWTPITLALVGFIGVVAAADMFGVHPGKSIWSNYERMDGLVTLVHVGAYALVASVLFQKERVVLWFLRVTLAVGGIVFVLSFLQWLSESGERVSSILGNPIYLAVYALFLIAIALVLALRAECHRWERFAYGMAAVAFAWMLYMTASRGAIIGLVLGSITTASALALSGNTARRARQGALVFLVLLGIGLGTFFAIKDSALVQNNPVLHRFATISLNEGTVFARTVVWGIAWDAFKERPLLGWGQEGFGAAFSSHYDPRMYAQEPWFDRAHNVILEWLVTAGALGLIAYGVVLVALARGIWRAQRLTHEQRWTLYGFLVAYIFHNLTVFDQLVSYLLFAVIVAWIAGYERRAPNEEPALAESENSLPLWASVAFAVVIVALVWVVHIPEIRHNKTLLLAMQLHARSSYEHAQGRTDEALQALGASYQAFEKALSSSPYKKQEVVEQLTLIALRVLSSSWVPTQDKALWYARTITALRAEDARYQYSARLPFLEARVHRAAGNLVEEKKALERALARSPKKQDILIELSQNARARGDGEEAHAFARQAYELMPEYGKAAALYAADLYVRGAFEQADAVVAKTPSAGEEPMLLDVLIALGEHERAMRTWQEAYTHAPAGRRARVAQVLVQAYRRLGDADRAQEVQQLLMQKR